MEHGNLFMIYLPNMVMFYSYVKLPEGKLSGQNS